MFNRGFETMNHGEMKIFSAFCFQNYVWIRESGLLSHVVDIVPPPRPLSQPHNPGSATHSVTFAQRDANELSSNIRTKPKLILETPPLTLQ